MNLDTGNVSDGLKVGAFHVDVARNRLVRNGKAYALEPQIMDVLCVLTEKPGEVFTRDDLIERIWKVEYGGDESLTRAISILRKTFKKAGEGDLYIETIYKRGYRLKAPISQIISKIEKKENDIKTGKEISITALAFEDMNRNKDQQDLSDGISEEIVNAQVKPPYLLDSKADRQYTSPKIEATERLQADIKHEVATQSKSISSVGNKTISKEMGKQIGIKHFATAGIVLAMILWMGSAIYPSQSISRGDRIKVGLDHVKNFTLDKAIPDAQTLFSDILLDDPNHAAAQAGMALALIREYTYVERDPALLLRAKSTAEISIRSAPQLAVSNVAYGWAVEYEGDFEEALKTYAQVDILDPNNLFALEGRIRIYQKKISRKMRTRP